jgi:hypothetical protein
MSARDTYRGLDMEAAHTRLPHVEFEINAALDEIDRLRHRTIELEQALVRQRLDEKDYV